MYVSTRNVPAPLFGLSMLRTLVGLSAPKLDDIGGQGKAFDQ